MASSVGSRKVTICSDGLKLQLSVQFSSMDTGFYGCLQVRDYRSVQVNLKDELLWRISYNYPRGCVN
jgi:hypothetical protein